MCFQTPKFTYLPIYLILVSLVWTVGFQNPKFKNFAQSITEPAHYENCEKVTTPSFFLLSKQEKRKRWFALLARAWLFFFYMSQILKILHKLVWTVGFQNPKFKHFAQSILASTVIGPAHYQNREKVRKTTVLPGVQTGETQGLARFARSPLAVFFGDKYVLS